MRIVYKRSLTFIAILIVLIVGGYFLIKYFLRE